MSTTIPNTWTGIPTVTPGKIAHLTEAYQSALRDEDKSGEPDTAAFWEGQRMAYETALTILHDTPGTRDEHNTWLAVIEWSEGAETPALLHSTSLHRLARMIVRHMVRAFGNDDGTLDTVDGTRFTPPAIDAPLPEVVTFLNDWNDATTEAYLTIYRQDSHDDGTPEPGDWLLLLCQEANLAPSLFRGCYLPFRTLPTAASGAENGRSFQTAEARDAWAQKHADETGEPVLIEEWSAEHTMDAMNDGWACVGRVQPTRPVVG